MAPASGRARRQVSRTKGKARVRDHDEDDITQEFREMLEELGEGPTLASSRPIKRPRVDAKNMEVDTSQLHVSVSDRDVRDADDDAVMQSSTTFPVQSVE